MRYFVIATSGEKPENVGVVFHDYVGGYVLCRSRKLSFYRAFNAVSDRVKSILIKASGEDCVRIRPFGVNDFGWIDRVLFETCGSYWKIIEEGKTSNSESAIDGIVREYLK